MISAVRRDKFLLGHFLRRCRRAASSDRRLGLSIVEVERNVSAVCLSLYLLSVRPSVCLSLCMSVRPSVCPSVRPLFACLPVCPSASLSICLSVCLSVSLSVPLCACLSVRPPARLYLHLSAVCPVGVLFIFLLYLRLLSR